MGWHFYVMEENKWKKTKSIAPTVDNLSRMMTMRKLAVRSFVLTATNTIQQPETDADP